jgi:hypothetical protein
MKTYLAATVGLAASLLLTSCVVESVQPLSSPDKAKADLRLAGIWRGKDGGLITSTHGAWLHVKIVGPPGDNQEPGSFDVFPTTIGNYTFLNVRDAVQDNPGKPATSYIFIRYAISSNHVLRTWMMSQNAVVNAVQSGKLKGHIQATMFSQPSQPDYDVTLEDTGANMTRFIQNSDIPALFNEAMKL